MKEKTKEFLKKYLIGFILGVVLAGAIIVYAETYFPSNDVTYDNTESGLSSTNVQGAIDELYGVCFPKDGSDVITDLLPSNPDELYKDDKGNIRYYGATPNNYVNFNGEKWRIIGVIDGKLKIVKDEKLDSMAWASNRNNNWNNSDLKSYLNKDYYKNLDSIYRGMISEEVYYLGGYSGNTNLLTASEFYDAEKSSAVYSGNPTSVKQYISLIYPSDYGYAAGSDCLSISLWSYSNNCKNNDYLFKGVNEWLQMPSVAVNFDAYYIDISGDVKTKGITVDNALAIRPSLYLKLEVKIVGGDGSYDNPYELSI